MKSRQERVLIVLDGPSGSGKTTFLQRLPLHSIIRYQQVSLKYSDNQTSLESGTFPHHAMLSQFLDLQRTLNIVEQFGLYRVVLVERYIVSQMVYGALRAGRETLFGHLPADSDWIDPSRQMDAYFDLAMKDLPLRSAFLPSEYPEQLNLSVFWCFYLPSLTLIEKRRVSRKETGIRADFPYSLVLERLLYDQVAQLLTILGHQVIRLDGEDVEEDAHRVMDPIITILSQE